MTIQLIGAAVLIGFFFVLWAIVGNHYASGAMASSIVMMMTALYVLVFSVRDISADELRNWGLIVLLIILGLANGYAVKEYASYLSIKDFPMAQFAVIVSVAMVIFAPVLEYFVSGKELRIDHFLGYGFAVAAIYFLGR